MSSFVLASFPPAVDPALRAAVLYELDAAVDGLDEAASALTILHAACSWESEGVEALRRTLWRLSEDTAPVRAMLQKCRSEAESA